MKFLIHDIISMPGYKLNEDVVYATDTYGWVIDGATGLNNVNLTGSESDAYWFVNEWDSYLKQNIFDNTIGINEIISKGIDNISNKFNEISTVKNPNKVDLPSASIVVIRINNNKAEYFLLGDCTLIVQDNNRKSSIIKQKLLDRLDNISKSKMMKLMNNEGLRFFEAREKINSILVKHRSLKNTYEGYWTLEFDKEAVKNAIYGYLDFSECKKALLMSDGFSAIFDNYNYTDENNIISLVEKEGLENVYQRIRTIEEEDEDILKYPRLKKSDDASAVIFSL